MKKSLKSMIALSVLLVLVFALAIPAFAAGSDAAAPESGETVEQASSVGDKAWAAGIAIGLAALGGALGMGWAIAKSVEGIARQPEVESKIRTTLMLGLVFVETAIIYALVITILIIFVL